MKAKAIFIVLFSLVFVTSGLAQDNAAKEKYNAGITAKQAKNWAEAEKNFLAAIAAYPQYANAYLELGTVRFNQNKLAPAEEAFQKVVSIEPNNGSGYKNLGLVQLTAKKYTLAEASLKKSLELKPGDPEIQKALGQLYLQQKNWDKSIEYYKMYNSANSVDAKGHFFMAQAYREKGDLAAAEKSFQEATRVDPKFAEAFYSYGSLLAAEKKYNGAISAFKSAIAYDRSMIKAYNLLAQACLDAQLYDEALKAYKDFVRVAEGKPTWKGQLQVVKTQTIPQIQDFIDKQGQ